MESIGRRSWLNEAQLAALLRAATVWCDGHCLQKHLVCARAPRASTMQLVRTSTLQTGHPSGMIECLDGIVVQFLVEQLVHEVAKCSRHVVLNNARPQT